MSKLYALRISWQGGLGFGVRGLGGEGFGVWGLGLRGLTGLGTQNLCSGWGLGFGLRASWLRGLGSQNLLVDGFRVWG